MTNIVVDYGKCIGCGACAEVCPDMFEIKYYKAWVIKADGCKTCDCSTAVKICPEGAIISV